MNKYFINPLRRLVSECFGRKAATEKAVSTEAGWATPRDIKAGGFFQQDDGVVLGVWVDWLGVSHTLRQNGPEHVLCYAPTRMGKGVSMRVPTLLSWRSSAVIVDFNATSWTLTAGWRKWGARNKVLRFEPTAEGSVRWNPLDEIRLGTQHEFADAQYLAALIIDPSGRGPSARRLGDYVHKVAQMVLTGCLLYLLHQAKRDGRMATLPSLRVLLSDHPQTLWYEMAASSHSVIRNAGYDMLDRSDEAGDQVLYTLKWSLALFQDPVVAANVAASDFRISDLRHHREGPISLFVVISSYDKPRLQPLACMLVGMILRFSAETSHRHRLLLMLEDFPWLGWLEGLSEVLASADHGIKGYLLCHDLLDIKARHRDYSPRENVISRCLVHCAVSPVGIDTAEYLSSHMPLTPVEILHLPPPSKAADGKILRPGTALILAPGIPAIRGKQALYFKDPVLLARAQVEAPKNSDILSPPAPVLRPEEEVQL